MLRSLEPFVQSFGLNVGAFAVAGVAIGAFLAVLGIASTFAPRDPVLERMGRQAGPDRRGSLDKGLLHAVEGDPTGMMRGLIPKDRSERNEVRRSLQQAGLTGPHVLRNYYLVRVLLGLVLPVGLLALVWSARAGLIDLPATIDRRLAGISDLALVQMMALMIGAGFFGPVIWLRSRVAERRQAIEESFPNALDLIQISVEAGMGFDAAMIRVGNELAEAAPALSQEFLTAQREIQAGRNRDRALLDMAARTGVDEVASFANVVLQSIQFGTSISKTLTAYSQDMRIRRELRAQEKANRLPVQMSAVMASLMLPALILLILGPIVIRYIRFFGA